MGADVRKEAADAVQHAHQIDVEHPSPVVERDIVDAAGRGDTGIVANHMDISERLVRGFRRALDAEGVSNIASDAAYIWPKIVQAFDGGRQCAGLDIGEHHLHAGLRKGGAERKADTTGAACHECCLARQLPHDCPRYLWITTEACLLLLA